VEDTLGRPNLEIRGLIATLETELGKERIQCQAAKHLKMIQAKAVLKRRRARYSRPEPTTDRLFAATYRHQHRRPAQCPMCTSDEFCPKAAAATCAELECDEENLVPRERLEPDGVQDPEIFVGRVASGDTVLKSGEHRDRLAAEHKVIGFEMEGAGVWDQVPCLLLKAVCDYADSHKNKAWQTYAAATAAAVLRAILDRQYQAEPAASPSSGPGQADALQWASNVVGARIIANNTFGSGTVISQGDVHGQSSVAVGNGSY
jgi:hypothetical protein